jgi:hypothetical protein
MTIVALTATHVGFWLYGKQGARLAIQIRPWRGRLVRPNWGQHLLTRRGPGPLLGRLAPGCRWLLHAVQNAGLQS